MTLNEISWCFTDEAFQNADEFNSEIIKYQEEIYKTNDKWQPTEIVANFPIIEIQYGCWITQASDLLQNEVLIKDDKYIFEEEPDEDEHQVEIIASLKADNEASFTALEFLQKVHNQLANKDLGDHAFFEGFDEPTLYDGIPLYHIYCGS